MVVKGEDGQSVLELLLMFPVLIGFTMILMKINTAIQISIVDQQYARAHALFLTFNHSVYPRISLQQVLMNQGDNQMLLGVSDNPASAGYEPEATIESVSRSKTVQAPDDPKTEPKTRARVRIRNSVTLCSPIYSLGPTLAMQDQKTGNSNLAEGVHFNYICGTQVPYEQ